MESRTKDLRISAEMNDLGNRKMMKLLCSCLGKAMDRGAWQATVHGIEESDMTEWLSLSFSVSKWSLLCPILCNPMDSNQLSSSIHEDSLVKNTGVGCHALLQGIFPTQGLNLGVPHCRQILYSLSHQGSPLKH